MKETASLNIFYFFLLSATLVFGSFSSRANELIIDDLFELKRENGIALFEGEPYTGLAVSACFGDEIRKVRAFGGILRYQDNEVRVFKNNELIAPLTRFCNRNQVISEYVNGLLNGPLKAFYENGTLLAEGNYKNGKRHGRFLRYFENGIIKSESSYKDGHPDGLNLQYHKNGQLKKTQTWVAGKGITGPVDYYDPCGQGNKLFTFVRRNTSLVEIQLEGTVIQCGTSWSDYRKNCMKTYDHLRELVGERGGEERNEIIKKQCLSGQPFRVVDGLDGLKLNEQDKNKFLEKLAGILSFKSEPYTFRKSLKLSGEWESVVVTAIGDEYFFQPEIQVFGPIRFALVLNNYNIPIGQQKAAVNEIQFNCESESLKILNDKYFSQHFGRGEQIQAFDDPVEWFQAPKDTAWSIITKRVCSYNPPQ